ncbi:hypothetical protein ACWT_5953 [Actinoplanes sp. SE50]|uniref:VOC family protein n=1 Tax=unclassified Actinoplanes TaxID=2626549 RepID=UPI00023EC178|nr:MULTISPECIES: VOC family protein [unclassified Actinoplanes]AEV86972.1 hypothetical protein ACPL_6085 [Actinoplanes sp. SE50/110]ATO85368.1 hypothetical protein ACWT_5953 [Actinoplanes sp. SE50]SLM02780.1 hypothetical protein ACSP50_6065 [Actinoplanes sp. SE50/110]
MDRPDHRLEVRDGAAAIAFYVTVFGAAEVSRECLLDGHPLVAELALGPYRLELVENPGAVAGGAPLVLPCADPGAVLARAVAAGAPVEAGVVRDPTGHRIVLEPAATPVAQIC